jgi:DnaJ-class molecular chaperone
VRFEFRGDPQDLAGFSDFFRTFFAAGPAPGASVAGEGARRRGTATTAEGMDFSDLLAGLGLDASSRVRHGASTQGPGAAQARRPEARVRVEVSLEEAYHGTKRLVQVDGKRLEVTIPRGVATGSRIRLSGQAGSGPQGGDVILEVAVREHPVFARRGDDLQRELPITLAEALLGGEVPVPTLKGRVLLRIPPETQSGRSFRLKGQGMPRFRKEGFGDLLVKVRVVLPSGLDAEGRSRLKAFLDHHPQPDPRRTTPGDHDA